MAKYLLSRYRYGLSSDNVSYVITRLKSYKMIESGDRAYCKVDKVIYKDEHYERLHRYKQYLPHKTKNGTYRIVGCFTGITCDTLLDFNSDEEALLWFEFNIKEN